MDDTFRTSIRAVAALVGMYRELIKTDGELELEVRIGRKINDKYVAGTERAFMDSAMRLMQTNDDMIVSPWKEHHDMFLAAPCSGVRVRVEFDTSHLEIQRTMVRKTCIKSAIVRSNDAMVKVSLNREAPVNDHLVPVIVNTEHVRIQQRRSYTYHSNWQYDFSMTWSGRTKSEAERSQQLDDPTFEMEIELIAGSYVAVHTDEFVAESLLLKAQDFTRMLQVP